MPSSRTRRLKPRIWISRWSRRSPDVWPPDRMTTATRTWRRRSLRAQSLHVRQRGELRHEQIAEALELGRQRQVLPERVERLVGCEAWAERRDLEQVPAGLAEVD